MPNSKNRSIFVAGSKSTFFALLLLVWLPVSALSANCIQLAQEIDSLSSVLNEGWKLQKTLIEQHKEAAAENKPRIAKEVVSLANNILLGIRTQKASMSILHDNCFQTDEGDPIAARILALEELEKVLTGIRDIYLGSL